MPATLQDVARMAGVSPSAASAALRPDRVSNVRLADATRRRVLAAAEALGYRSNPLARGLRGEATRTIGVLWWLGSPPARESMARRLAQMLQARGYSTHLADHFASPEHVVETLRDLAVRGIDGVVLESDDGIAASDEVGEALRAFNASIVVQPIPTRTPIGTDVIIHDRLAAIRGSVDHLMSTGRRRPVFLVARHANVGKAAAFLDALRRHGVEPDPASVIDLDERGTDNLCELTTRVLDARLAAGGDVAFDAVLTTSDEVAVGAMAWLRARGRRIPEEVAVIGANDTHIAGFLAPPLASVDRREPELVDLIETRLFERLADPGRDPTVATLTMRFVWRESAGGVALSPIHP